MSRSRDRSRSDAAPSEPDALTAHGWTLLAHPCFLDQLERLLAAVESEARRNPDLYTRSANYKVLAAIAELALERIPRNPSGPEYRHGGTLRGGRRHWFRAKFGNGRFRLFFRFRSDARIVVYAWVNDEETLRTYGSATDAYAVFSQRLDAGRPPDDWDALLAEARSPEAVARAVTAAEKIGRVAKRRND